MWRWLTDDFLLKVLSLGISITLWYTLVGEQELSSSITVPIQYRNIPRYLEISSNIQERVRLDLIGPPSKLRHESLVNAAAVIDLAGVQRAGERTFSIDQGSLRLPVGVRLLRSVPTQVRLRFEAQMSKEVPVHVRLAGEPASGYGVTEAKADPPKVRIVGPASEVTAIDAVETDMVDIQGIMQTSRHQAHLYAERQQVRFETNPVVNVNVVVQRMRQ